MPDPTTAKWKLLREPSGEEDTIEAQGDEHPYLEYLLRVYFASSCKKLGEAVDNHSEYL